MPDAATGGQAAKSPAPARNGFFGGSCDSGLYLPDGFGYNRQVFRLGNGQFAHFFMVTDLTDIETLSDKTLTGLGYELVDLEMTPGGTLRLFIDKPGGVTVDDCADVSRHLSRLFAAEDIDYKYLEVSSPGLDRVLKKERDFIRFLGHAARIETRLPVNGQRKFSGCLKAFADGRLTVTVTKNETETDIVIERGNIERARLKPEI